LTQPDQWRLDGDVLAKKIALAFGIAVIFPWLVHYGVSTFWPQPKWEDYMVQGGYDPAASRPEREQRQAEQRKLQDSKKAADKVFAVHLFAIAAPLGLAAILCGAFLRVQSVGTGLMFGGIFSVCDGYVNYWRELPDALRFVSLLAAFIVLVWVGYKKLEKNPAA
jgi:hypothetical protein